MKKKINHRIPTSNVSAITQELYIPFLGIKEDHKSLYTDSFFLSLVEAQ